MAKKVITISNSYAKPFKSICTMYKEGFVSKNVVNEVSLDETTIKGANNVDFILSDGTKPVTGEKEIVLTKEGSSWFSTIREQTKVDNSASLWLSLMNDVSFNFHKDNSYVEFKQKPKILTAEEDAKNKKIVNSFLNVFYPHLANAVTVVRDDSDNNIDDIYGVNLLLNINNGAGESQILMSKAYFSRNSRGIYTPINANFAQTIEEQIYGLLDETNNGVFSNIEDVKSIDVILLQVENLLKNMGDKVADYLLINSETDNIIVDSLLRNASDRIVPTLTCRKLKVIGISHVRWKNFGYSVLNKGQKILDASFTVDGKFSLSCASCNAQGMIVLNNNIQFPNGDEIALDNTMLTTNFGLTEEQIKFILENANVKDHLISQRCDRDCKRVICAENIIEFGGKKFCKDCPYPDIIYRNEKGEVFLTASLALDRSSMTLVDKSEVAECECCHRTFKNSELINGKCKLCNKIEAPFDVIGDENVYDKYGVLFSSIQRLINSGKKDKVALEDNEIVLVRLKRRIYMFKKTNVTSKGYIEGLKRIK